MHVIDFPSSYRNVLDRVSRQGRYTSPRGDATVELINFNLIVEDTTHTLPVGVGRRASTKLADEITYQALAGVYLPDRLKALQSNFLDDDKLESYGPLLQPGIARSIKYLHRDPNTRRAAANLGHTGGDSGYPCTVSLGWLIREGKLHAFSEMRSQDAWLGLPYDVHLFAGIQRTLAAVLDVKPGPLHHRVRSFHLYLRDLEKVQEVHSAPTHRRVTTSLGETPEAARIVRAHGWPVVAHMAHAALMVPVE